ncbi:MAG: SIR2 family protein [Clostridium botulinum]|nr:SIR2 family protein [Clostridium botulinum]
MQSFINESKRIIRKASENNKLVIFVGAGVSANSGYPSWTSLVEEFARGLGIDTQNISSEDYLKIPQYYYNSRKEKDYYDVIWDKFNVNVKPNDIHDAIFKLKPYHIVTTNYDELLEEAARNQGVFYDVVSKDEDLPYTLNNNMIIKMHGDLKNKNIVLKEDDYLSYFRNFKLIQNYIKSLISTYTILFLGYSINDINVKYIFQWVKDILGNSFQQAYFLENNQNKKFNQVEFDYYKNRGINILYYSETDEIKYLKKSIQFKNLTDERAKNTCIFLRYILDTDSLNKINIDYAYERLKNLNNLNKIFFQNIIDALDLETPFEENDGTIVYSHFLLEKESLELNTSIVTNLFLEIKEYDNKLNKFNKCEDYKEKGELKKEIDFSKEIKVNLIKQVLYKAGIKKIVARNENYIKEVLSLHRKSEGLEKERAIEYSFELNINLYDKMDELEEYISQFDYLNMYRCLDDMKLEDIDGNEEKFFNKAYLLYKLGEYLQAYEVLKRLSQTCFLNKKYYLYFISEFNRYYLGHAISTFNIFSISMLGIHEDIQKEIREEIRKIDLDNIYLKLPSSNRVKLLFLKDILNLKFVYRKIRDTADLKEKVEKNKDNIYIGKGSSDGEIHKFKKNIEDFWKFITKNRLMLDNYKELEMVFYNYIESALLSHMTKYIEEKESILGLPGKVIKLKKIDGFTLFVMVNYSNIKQIKYLFEKYDVQSIKLEEKALEFVQDTYDNVINSILQKKNILEAKQILNKFIYILSRIDVGKELFIRLIDGFLKVIDNYSIELDKLYENLLIFIIKQNNNFKENISIEKIEEIFNYMLYKISSNLEKDRNFYKENTAMNFIRQIAFIMDNINQDYKFKDDKNLKLLIRQMEVEMHLYILEYTLIPVYKLVDKELQNDISKLVYGNLNDNEKFNKRHFSVYYKAVIDKIILSSVELEEKILEFINKQAILKNENLEILLLNIAYLILNDLIIQSDKFYKFKDNSEKFSFLIDIANYNYDNFELEWIFKFSDELHGRVYKCEKAKIIIKEKFQQYIIQNECEKHTKNIFFRYYN